MVQVYGIEENSLIQIEYYNNVGTFGDYGIVNMGFFSKEKNSKKVLYFLDETLTKIKRFE